MSNLLLDYGTYVPYEDFGPNVLVFGLELELMEPDWDELKNMSNRGAICTAENEEWDAPAYLKYDGTVDAELTFCATTHEKLMDRVMRLTAWLEPDNTDQTSAHVHINRPFLNNLGITADDILKAANYIEPLSFKISGRSNLKWAKSDLYDSDTLREGVVLDSDHGRRVDNFKLTGPRLREHERHVNFEHGGTYEFRTFSNVYNNSVPHINAYVKMAELAVFLSIFMKGRRYAHNRVANDFIYNFLENNVAHDLIEKHMAPLILRNKPCRRLL